MKELMEHQQYTAELKETLDKSVRVYHATKTRYLTTIMLRDGLIPGVNYDRAFYGIGQDVIDMFAPRDLRRQGVLRRNVVYARLSADEAFDGTNRKNAVLAFDINPSRVYVGDEAAVPVSAAWNLCLAEPCVEAENLLRKPDWTEVQPTTLSELFAAHFLEEDFLDQILSRFVQNPTQTLENQLTEIIHRGHQNINTAGRRVAMRYWRKVVPYEQFQNDFGYNPKIKAWVSCTRPLIRIYQPEALIVGSVAPESIHFLGRGNKRAFIKQKHVFKYGI